MFFQMWKKYKNIRVDIKLSTLKSNTLMYYSRQVKLNILKINYFGIPMSLRNFKIS